MSSVSKEPERPPAKQEVQVDLIMRNYAKKGVKIKRWPPDEQADLDFLYEEGVVLVRDAYLAQVREILGGEVREGFIDGVTVLSLKRVKEKKFENVMDVVSEIDGRLGTGVATPNHIFWITPVYCCPAT